MIKTRVQLYTNHLSWWRYIPSVLDIVCFKYKQQQRNVSVHKKILEKCIFKLCAVVHYQMFVVIVQYASLKWMYSRSDYINSLKSTNQRIQESNIHNNLYCLTFLNKQLHNSYSRLFYGCVLWITPYLRLDRFSFVANQSERMFQ